MSLVPKWVQVLQRGDTLGTTLEGRFHHQIMVPFALYGIIQDYLGHSAQVPIPSILLSRKLQMKAGKEYAFTMVQRWPIKNAVDARREDKADKDDGYGYADHRHAVSCDERGDILHSGSFWSRKNGLQHHLSKYSSVDIVVVVACGERAGEVVEVLREFPHLIDPHTGETLMTRTVIICNTSSMPVAARESSVYMGMTIARILSPDGSGCSCSCRFHLPLGASHAGDVRPLGRDSW